MVILVMDDNQENLSVLIIKFNAPGSVFFDVEAQGNVFPGQMIVIGEYLIEKGKEITRIAEQMQQAKKEEQHIAIPKPKLVRQ